MNSTKLYNVIFPIWFLLFFPPVIFVTLIGNFIIDSIVLLGCFFLFKLPVRQYYKECIIKVWLFGFLSDIVGAAVLFILGMWGNFFGLPNEWISGISYDPFSHPAATIIIVSSMLVSGMLIFWFNYNITLKNLISEKMLRLKIVLIISIITLPWTYLLPTKWFY